MILHAGSCHVLEALINHTESLEDDLNACSQDLKDTTDMLKATQSERDDAMFVSRGLSQALTRLTCEDPDDEDVDDRTS